MMRERDRAALRRPELIREATFIAGGWLTGESWIDVRNPATGGLVGRVPAFGRAEAEQAVAAADSALPAWRALAAGERAAFLHRWHDLILENQEDLARILSCEQGKPLAEARGEVAYSAAFVLWFAEEARRVYGDIIPGQAADKRIAVLRQPVGVVAAITPWNFPLAMITRKAGPALAVGCTMVLKPSELTPFSALALGVLAEEAGFPAGVLNIVTGPPEGIGDVFVGDERVAKFSFTGSTQVGKMLAARCMSSVKRVSLELGGNAPFIVFADADLEQAVDGAIASKFRNAGQTCVCANRLLIQENIRAEFASRLAVRVRELSVGDALEGDAPVGPLIDTRALEKAQRHVDDAVARGARLLVGGHRVERDGYFFTPTVLDGVDRDAVLCREESFAPVAGIVGFADEAEAVRLANHTRAGLAAYLFTRDLSRAHRVSEALEYGMVGINTGLISTEVAPFGGIKESGFGREGARYGVDDYVNLKLVCTSIASADQ